MSSQISLGTHLSPLLPAPKSTPDQPGRSHPYEENTQFKDFHLVFFFLPHGLIFRGPREILSSRQESGATACQLIWRAAC